MPPRETRSSGSGATYTFREVSEDEDELVFHEPVAVHVCNRCHQAIDPSNGEIFSDDTAFYCFSCFDQYMVRCDNCSHITNRWTEHNGDILCSRCASNHGVRIPGVAQRNGRRVLVTPPSWEVPDVGWGLQGTDSADHRTPLEITQSWRAGPAHIDNPDDLNGYHSRTRSRTEIYPNTRYGTRIDEDWLVVGVELEVITHLDKATKVIREVVKNANTFSVFAESDSSLSGCCHDGGDRGVEFVTQPHHASLAFPDTYVWMNGIQHTTAWNENCCGLHVNIDKRALNSHVHLARLLALMHGTETNSKFWERMARRKSKQNLQTYAAIPGMSTGELLQIAQEKRSFGKYRALRLEKPGCIEFRIYQATLSPESLCGAVWMSLAAVLYSRDHGYKEMDAPLFVKWLYQSAKDAMYPEPWINAGLLLAAEYESGAKVRY